ncbi:small integral membrane protein 24 [Xenopus laevis]|nr:small integral membrane protein 24 [Xenopus laevis]
MSTLCSVVIGLILVFSAMAQGTNRASSVGNSYTLQPWLLGLTAVVVFLFIVFVLLLVNRMWFKKKKQGSIEENPKEERVEINAYENKAMEKDDDDEEKDSKITAM